MNQRSIQIINYIGIKMTKPLKKHLLFTSAGDLSNLPQWLHGEREFDIFVAYYGDNHFPQENSIEYFRKRKGGKFQNLYYFFQHENELFNDYESILVLDDDIIINCSQLNHLFKIMEKSGLDLLQPAYDRRGKISHKITEYNPFTSMRLTNFIEVGVPLFSKRALKLFMNKFDPRLNCCGVDWWFCHETQKEFGIYTIGITDVVICLNPHDQDKALIGPREIDKLFLPSERYSSWKAIKKEKGLTFSEDIYKVYFSRYSCSLYRIWFWLYTKIADLVLRIYRKIYRFLK